MQSVAKMLTERSNGYVEVEVKEKQESLLGKQFGFRQPYIAYHDIVLQ